MHSIAYRQIAHGSHFLTLTLNFGSTDKLMIVGRSLCIKWQNLSLLVGLLSYPLIFGLGWRIKGLASEPFRLPLSLSKGSDLKREFFSHNGGALFLQQKQNFLPFATV